MKIFNKVFLKDNLDIKLSMFDYYINFFFLQKCTINTKDIKFIFIITVFLNQNLFTIKIEY